MRRQSPLSQMVHCMVVSVHIDSKHVTRARPIVMVVCVLLGAWISACDGAGERSGFATSRPSPSVVSARGASAAAALRGMDGDGDSDYNDDDYKYGGPADAVERRLVIGLVKRYYAAAIAGNGGKGCSLIYSLLAEEVPEEYGEPPGPIRLRGSTCSMVMSKLFKQEHKHFAVEASTLKVVAVRLRRSRGLAILSFGATPPRDIAVHREFGRWKIDELLDTPLG